MCDLTGKPPSATLGHMDGRTIDNDALDLLRVEAGLTWVKLARLSGVSISLIKYVRKGDRQFSRLSATKIAKVLGCQVEDISYADASSDAERSAA